MCQGIKKRCFTPATIFKSPEDSRFVRADALAMGDKVLNRDTGRSLNCANRKELQCI